MELMGLIAATGTTFPKAGILATKKHRDDDGSYIRTSPIAVSYNWVCRRRHGDLSSCILGLDHAVPVAGLP